MSRCDDSAAVIPRRATLTTRRKSPNVNTISGNVSKRNSGPKMPLTTEKITANHRYQRNPPWT